MVTILVVLFILICPLIIFIVLMQDAKGGGLAGALGGAGGGSAFGAKTAGVVMKTTVALGIVFFLLALALGLTLKEPLGVNATDIGPEAPVTLPVEDVAPDEGASEAGIAPVDAPTEAAAPAAPAPAAPAPSEDGS